MQGVDQEFVFVLSGSFFCAFLTVVALGGAFLMVRLRQQEQHGGPAPEPPVMTRDAHAAPLRADPARPPSVADRAGLDAETLPMPEPPPSPEPAAMNEPQSISEFPTFRPEASGVKDSPQTPLGLGDAASSSDEDAETRVLKKSTGPVTDTIRSRPPPLTPISLVDALDEENPTVIVDRTKPSDLEDDE